MKYLFFALFVTLICVARGGLLDSVPVKTPEVTQVFTANDEYKQVSKKAELECISETNVDPELIRRARADNDFVDSVPLKRFFVCVLGKFNILGTDNSFDKTELRSILSKYFGMIPIKIDSLVDECAKSKSSPQDSAFEYFKCVRRLNIIKV